MATTSIQLESSDEFPGGPVSACVEIPPGDGGLTLVEESSGSRKAAQAGGPGRMVWIEGPLAAGESRSYSVESEEEGGGGVEITDSGEGSLDISVGGEPFTSYVHGPEWFRPYFHPVLGPHGLPVTRGFPMVADVPGETSDHPHHKGIWSAYGEAGNVDNWAEGGTSGRTLHRGFETVESGPVFGRFVGLGDWVDHDGGPAVLAERRTVTVYATAPHRLFDYELALTATGSDALFGDTKEGGFISLRVATSMDAKTEGRLENSRGGVGETDVWGKRAEWCDYSGPVEGKTAGVRFPRESRAASAIPPTGTQGTTASCQPIPSACPSSWARATAATTCCQRARPSSSATASTSTRGTPEQGRSRPCTVPTRPRLASNRPELL